MFRKGCLRFPSISYGHLIALQKYNVNLKDSTTPRVNGQTTPRVTPASQILLKPAYFGLKVLKGKRWKIRGKQDFPGKTRVLIFRIPNPCVGGSSPPRATLFSPHIAVKNQALTRERPKIRFPLLSALFRPFPSNLVLKADRNIRGSAWKTSPRVIDQAALPDLACV